MKIAIIGGGPAGLYLAILMKKSKPAHEIAIYERNQRDDTFGWGVVFSDQTLDNLRGGDSPSHERIAASFARWSDIEVHFKATVITSGGHGFCGIERKHLLHILQQRAEELGVRLHFDTFIDNLAELGTVDLIVAADGVHSRIRSLYAEDFKPSIQRGNNKFIWLGTHKLFHVFAFIFVETEWGWFQAHAYRFNETTSTFIVETSEETWKRAGLDHADTTASIAFCERLFASSLDGHSLQANGRHQRGSEWIHFQLVSNQHWVKDNIVLVGDAAHTAHFSIGSGTKLALEDAIALAEACDRCDDIPTALETYEKERRVDVLRIQSAARNSTDWFEHVDRYATLPPEQFAYSMLTRSQRISHENLRLRDPAYISSIEKILSDGAQASPRAPMFLPLRLRAMQLENRVVLAPLGLCSATGGLANDLHLSYYGARATGGAGLLLTEMCAVAPEGRLTAGCTGIWNHAQASAWKRITDFVHLNSPAKIGLQIGHAGPKGATKPYWEGNGVPLSQDAWPLIAPSAVPWSAASQTPSAMVEADFLAIHNAFVAAAAAAEQAGFDMLELQAGHGTLLSAFLSPLTNFRTDEFGGTLADRLRFPLAIFHAIRAVWPASRPIGVRISAVDWVEGGTTLDEAVAIAQAFKDAGADILDISSGETSIHARPVYGRMFQAPFSDRIRNEVGIPTIAVGNITDSDQINSIIAAGRADLCALGRPHLSMPNFTQHAAAKLGFKEQAWPAPFMDGKPQLESLYRRFAATQLA
jgi:anthraniloyl-CoA monooxygenase